MKIGRLKTDAKKEKEGVWCEVGEGFEVLIARMNNPRYEEYILKEGKPFGYGARVGLVDPEKLMDLTRKAMAETIVLDWKGLEDETGIAIPYSKEKALELLTTHSEFYRIVQLMANDTDLFRTAAREEAAKN